MSQAPCTGIIQEATSIMDYDLREEGSRGAAVRRVCPVLHDLYGAPETKSEPRPAEVSEV